MCPLLCWAPSHTIFVLAVQMDALPAELQISILSYLGSFDIKA